MAKQAPERTCIVSRKAGPASELMRFVLGPDGEVVPDLRCRLPGRGAWVSPTAAALATAVKRKLFSRALKADAKATPALVAMTDAALVRDLLGALSLANKAGAVIAGFAKVESALAAGGVAALVHAAEASPDGRRKLAGRAWAALRKDGADPISPLPIYDDLGGDDLDMALGRVHVIHAALLAGTGSEGCLVRWRRLRLFRGVGDDATVPRDVVERFDEPLGPTGRIETG